MATVAPEIVNEHTGSSEPLQGPAVQPRNDAPPVGFAVRVTVAPEAKVPLHRAAVVLRQEQYFYFLAGYEVRDAVHQYL